MGFSGGSEVKTSACNEGDLGSIPGSGKSPGKGNGNPFQYSCLENPMYREAWWATVHGVASWTRLSDCTFTFITNYNHASHYTWLHLSSTINLCYEKLLNRKKKRWKMSLGYPYILIVGNYSFIIKHWNYWIRHHATLLGH